MSITAHYKKTLGQFNFDAEFSIPSHGITILFGPSGSGKTTLLNCIAGFQQADLAYLSLNDTIFDNSQQNIRLSTQQRRIGYVFQDTRLFPHLTVAQNLDYGYHRNSQHTAITNHDELISTFSLQSLLQHYPHQLSGGQKQRVALARALLANPQLLILDEPMSALDRSAKQELMPYLESIHNQFTLPVIYVSHDLREVLRLGDYILLMEDGRIIDHGNLMDLCVKQPLLTQDEGASFILSGLVEQVDEKQSISSVNCNGHRVYISGRLLTPQQQVRILVHAQDVSLTLSHASDSSILNILPATVQTIHPAANGKHLVECEVNGNSILAMISIRSVNNLGLARGREVFAQFKATAMVR
ncbi:MAG: molybdenum ABC transporter ATP-binding protein [Gammaproteobacteria bacterium]|nr:molybdenum ABC transporter ATP-binding protein [Gammaproteobacteria bacterium]